MKFETKEYYVDSDSLCITLYKKGIIVAGKKTKEDNVGKDKLDIVGYFGTLPQVLNAMSKQTVLDNDELSVIADKLVEIQETADRIEDLLKIKIKGV